MLKKKAAKIKKVVKHLKGDIHTFKREANEDKKLIKSLKKTVVKKKETKKKVPLKDKKEKKIAKVMREFKRGVLHSGSKRGPEVKKKSQAIAIALSEAKKVGKKVVNKKKK